MAKIVDDLLFMDVKAVTFFGDGKRLPYSYCTETVNRLAEGGRRILRQDFLPCTIANTGAENNYLHDEFKGMSRAQISEAKGLNEKNLDGGSLSRHENWLLKPYGRGAFARMQTVIGADCKVYTCQDTAYTETGIWTT